MRVCAVSASTFSCASRRVLASVKQLEIKNSQLRIFFTGDERQPVLAVNQQSVWFTATRQSVSRDDLVFRWIYLGELIFPVYGNEDVFRH